MESNHAAAAGTIGNGDNVISDVISGWVFSDNVLVFVVGSMWSGIICWISDRWFGGIRNKIGLMSLLNTDFANGFVSTTA